MLTIAWLALGFLLAAGYLVLVACQEPQQERKLIALGLATAALICLIFAIAWGDSTLLLIESLGVACYAFRRNPVWIQSNIMQSAST